MPLKEEGMVERHIDSPVEVHHHLGDALFGWRDFTVVGSEAEILANGRLEAVAIEDFALDLRRIQRLIADELDDELLLVIFADVTNRA